uniref:Ctc-interacting domain 3 n=1 Tax=Tetraselmis sp. GSL018 TaxID=582737 RepID=A0A061SAY3_9CHLO|mmetsp:Transcript_41769/g.99086  ORF Transcript_41769/g.99086 Transcript_41769/m.99086 type:complete len:615 (+) Transcript_41769:401-2245(+)
MATPQGKPGIQGSWRDSLLKGAKQATTAMQQTAVADGTAKEAGFGPHILGPGVEKLDQRFLFCLQVLIGQPVQAKVRGGKVYQGVFSKAEVSADGGLAVDLEMATVVREGDGEVTDMKQLAERPEPLVVISSSDLLHITAKDIRMNAGEVGPVADDMGFGTDSAISRGRGGSGLVGRELERWVPDGGMDMTLEGLALDDTSYRGWDQFAVNSEQYGVRSTYDEAIYTTKLDRNSSKITEAEAARIAREIERGDMHASNAHVLEERGISVDDTGEMDEEDRYSSVIRKDTSKPEARKPSAVPAWSVAGAGVAAVQGDVGKAKSAAEPAKPKDASEADGKSGGADGEGAAASLEGDKADAPPSEGAGGDPKPEREPLGTDEAEGSAAEAAEGPDGGEKQGKADSKPQAAEEGGSGSADGGEKKPKSTLNPNAKAFTLNPNAKEFVPSGGGGGGSGGAGAARSSSSASASSSSGGVGYRGHRGGGGHWSGGHSQHHMVQGMPMGGAAWMGSGPAGFQPGIMPMMVQPGQAGGRGHNMMGPGFPMNQRFPPQNVPQGYYSQAPGYMSPPNFVMMPPGGGPPPRPGQGGYSMPYGMQLMGPMGGPGMGMQPDMPPSGEP